MNDKNMYNGASISLDAFEVLNVSSQLSFDIVNEDLEFSQSLQTPIQFLVTLSVVHNTHLD